ncbi:polysaccharide deacetylase family protein [Aerosakkonemataceae cyanobacterium BLCC-F50]|uniref:Polysaccharide deacetylase family protein n=1 Tax=Floridaenema flaviceps BLCC-F50 TaxID=3153642 RepID=A0ABV4XYF8_9CYAN
MLRLSRRNLKFCTYVSLFAAACSFCIGGGLSIYEHSQQTYRKKPLVITHPLLKKDLSQLFGVEQKPDKRLQPDLNEKPEIPPTNQENPLPPLAFKPPISFQGKAIKQVKLGVQDKVIALTFDDGPWGKYTNEILEILKDNDIKATFFWIGRNVKAFPQIALQVVAEGHAIGNHTWSHSYRNMNKVIAYKEIESTKAIIKKITNVETTLFRPPGGILINGPAGYALSQKYAVLMWSDDSTDYARDVSVNTIINRVKRGAKPGAIVLMHDGGGDRSRTVQALPTIINSLKKQGYRFVTIPELMGIQKSDASGDQETIKPEDDQTIKPGIGIAKPGNNNLVKPRVLITKPGNNNLVKPRVLITKPANNKLIKSGVMTIKPANNKLVKSGVITIKPGNNKIIQPGIGIAKPANNKLIKSGVMTIKPGNNKLVKSGIGIVKPANNKLVKPGNLVTKGR